MPGKRRRPTGVIIIAILLAANGIGSLVEAFSLVGSVGGEAAAILSALVGLALLHRAYAIWSFQRTAYLITLALLGIRAVLLGLDLITGPSAVAAWINLAVILAALLYLVQPSVRDLFSGHRAGGA